MAGLERDELLAALAQLDSEDETTIAAAGRAASALLAETGLTWPDVIVDAAALVAASNAGEADSAGDAASPANPAESQQAAANPQDAAALIEQLLARKNLFEGTRAELLAYKDDIAAGEFDDSDLAYLNALNVRVVKNSGKTGD